jgi:hypothetical protein
MKHHLVSSGHIESIAHKGDVMHVKFKGGNTYEYKGVSEMQFNQLKSAPSTGKHLAGMGVKGAKL